MQEKNDIITHRFPAAVMDIADARKQFADRGCSLEKSSMSGEQGVLEVAVAEQSKRTCSLHSDNSENSTDENSELSLDADSADVDSAIRIDDSSSVPGIP